MQGRLVSVMLQLQIAILWNYSQESKRLVFFRAYYTNLLESICEILTPSAVRLAQIFHSQRFFSGWNWTAKMGQSLDSRVEMKVSPPLLLVVEVTFQKSMRQRLAEKEEVRSPSQWLKQRMPVPLERSFLRSPSSWSYREEGYPKVRVLIWWEESRMGCSTEESKREVRQVSSSNPRQVPQMGKTLPCLFWFMAHWSMKFAFLTHRLLSMVISSSPAPPVKRTPLTLRRTASMSDWLLKAKMGTTWAPDIQTYFTQAVEMYVLSNSLVEGSLYSSIWVYTPMTGF